MKSYENIMPNLLIKRQFLEYHQIQIEKLKSTGKERTSETYKQMLLSFMKFRNGEDLFFDIIDEALICQYEVICAYSVYAEIRPLSI